MSGPSTLSNNHRWDPDRVSSVVFVAVRLTSLVDGPGLERGPGIVTSFVYVCLFLEVGLHTLRSMDCLISHRI